MFSKVGRSFGLIIRSGISEILSRQLVGKNELSEFWSADLAEVTLFVELLKFTANLAEICWKQFNQGVF